MTNINIQEKINNMKQGGEILATVLDTVMEHVKEGVSELELDELAEKLILEKGGKPGFKMVEGYKNTICISTNDVVVHGIPTGYRFKKGDKVGVDCGVFYKGFHTDMAETVEIDSNKYKDFLKIGKMALEEGIKQAKIGNRVGHISKAIQQIVEEKAEYSIVRSLVGHGVGRNLHEEPEIPGYLDVPIDKTPLLKEWMTIAIEVIYNMGASDVMYGNRDGWTIRTEDGSISGLFERSVAITRSGPVILTK